MKNGLYLRPSDNEEFGDEMGAYLNSYDHLRGIEIPQNERKMRCQHITFVVTEQCNLNCTYCYETHKTKRVMTKEVAKQAVDMILDNKLVNGYYNPDYTQIVVLEFIGGEPFLNIDIIDYIVEYFKFRANELNHVWANNYMLSFSSNGTLYFEPKVQDFLNRNKGRVSLGITIDGNKELHDKCRLFHDGRGSYDIVEKAVLDWNTKRLGDTDTKVTLAPENIEYLVEAEKNLHELGIKFAFTNCCFEEGWTIEHAKVFYQQLKELADYIIDNDLYNEFCCSLFDESCATKSTETKNWCGGNGDMLAIGLDGKCFSCIRFMQYSLNNQKEQPIGDVWNGLDSPEKNCWLCALQKVNMISQCSHEDNKKCLDCPISSGCGLCSGFNYDTFGDPDHKATYICDMHRARSLGNVYFWNKLYRKLDLDQTFELNLDDQTSLTIIDEIELEYLKHLATERGD